MKTLNVGQNVYWYTVNSRIEVVIEEGVVKCKCAECSDLYRVLPHGSLNLIYATRKTLYETEKQALVAGERMAILKIDGIRKELRRRIAGMRGLLRSWDIHKKQLRCRLEIDRTAQ